MLLAVQQYLSFIFTIVVGGGVGGGLLLLLLLHSNFLSNLIYTGYCKKLSGRKNVLKDCYLKLSTNGILSWFKGEDDSEPRRSLVVQGEKLSLDQDDPKTAVFIHISQRRFHFQFFG